MGLRSLLRNDVEQLNFDHDLTQEEPWASYWANHVDLPRMRKGQMGGQFWSAFISCKSQFVDAVQLFLEQIDVIKQFVARWVDMWSCVFTLLVTFAGTLMIFSGLLVPPT